MNQRNVEALTAVLKAMLDGDCGNERALAEDLAARGVLVPSALTGVDAWHVVADIDGATHTTEEARAALLIKLERIARGDPA